MAICLIQSYKKKILRHKFIVIISQIIRHLSGSKSQAIDMPPPYMNSSPLPPHSKVPTQLGDDTL